MVEVKEKTIKEQYGNYVFFDNDSHAIQPEVKQLLKENMKDECKKHDIDMDEANIDYIFKPVDEITKIERGFDPNQDIWTGAWKVTVWS